MSASGPAIEFATRDEAGLVLAFIRELAEYEKLLDHAVASEADIANALFGPRPAAECLIARLDGAAVGFAIFFHNFSTFVGRAGLYVEDVFVRPAARGRGVGKALFARMAAIALERRCGRMEWTVLDWNEPAIRFYRAIGAVALDGWTIQRLSGTGLAALARPSAAAMSRSDRPH